MANEINNPFPNQHANSDILTKFMENMFRKYDVANGYIIPGTEDKTTMDLDNDWGHNKEHQSLMWGLMRGFGRGWGGSALKSSRLTNTIAHIVAEYNGVPESWNFNEKMPEDLSTSGRPIFRSEKNRNEIWQ